MMVVTVFAKTASLRDKTGKFQKCPGNFAILKLLRIKSVISRRSGAVVRASDFGQRGPWVESRPAHISLWPWASHIYPLLSTG